MQHPFPIICPELPRRSANQELVCNRSLETTLKQIASDLTSAASGELLVALLTVLSKTFPNRFLFVLEVSADDASPSRLTLASQGELWDCATFKLEQSACAAVLAHGFQAVQQGARALFPNDILLTGLAVESFLGCPIEAYGTRGVFGMLGGEALTAHALEESVMRIYTPHVAAALACRHVREQARNEGEEERLKRENLEALGNAASGIAHDFNNLLTAVLGNLSLALRSRGLGAQLVEQLGAAKSAGLRAHELAQQLHSFARASTPVKTRSDLGGLVRETIGFSLFEGGGHGEVVVPAELWMAEIDCGQIGQALHNLSVYAQKTVGATAGVKVNCLNLALQDEPGIAAGDYVVIRFQKPVAVVHEDPAAAPFLFPLQNMASDLGVTAARCIIHGHGGRMKTGPDRETIFEVFLPAVPEKAFLPFPATVPEDASRPAASRVLVIDDEKVLCELLANALQPLGCEVSETQDGREAIALYQQALQTGRPFDLVITDLLMPASISGLELLSALQAIDPQACVIVSSGHTTDPVLTYYREHGFRGALSKPYDLNALESVVMAVISSVRGVRPLSGVPAPALPTASGWTAFPKAHALLA